MQIIKNRFDLNVSSLSDPEWVVQYCLTRLSELRIYSSGLRCIVIDGGFSGDIEWGVHRWDIHAEHDYGISARFQGYRFYVGPEETGLDKDIEGFIPDGQLKNLLMDLSSWYISKHPERRGEVYEALIDIGYMKK
ncbi:hypothetical protein ACCI51_15960 [Microbulbifer echini]|uniref:Uncharacterized protein n=1 Tax=Microbulbifer echini TaxID=1529067 RepID=A0ABV4NS83_9GAMM